MLFTERAHKMQTVNKSVQRKDWDSFERQLACDGCKNSKRPTLSCMHIRSENFVVQHYENWWPEISSFHMTLLQLLQNHANSHKCKPNAIQCRWGRRWATNDCENSRYALVIFMTFRSPCAVHPPTKPFFLLAECSNSSNYTIIRTFPTIAPRKSDSIQIMLRLRSTKFPHSSLTFNRPTHLLFTRLNLKNNSRPVKGRGNKKQERNCMFYVHPKSCKFGGDEQEKQRKKAHV